MSQDYPLDALIRRLDRRSVPEQLDQHQHLVIFDARHRQVLPREPAIKIGRDLRYFLVSTRPGAVEWRGPVCKVKSPTLQASCEIAVAYDARCEPGREATLVAALHGGEHPAAALDAFIASCVEKFSSNAAAAGRDPCLELAANLPALSAFLRERCLDEVGVSLEPTIRFPLLDKLQPLTIKTGYFPVRVCDYDRQLELKLATEVEVDDGNFIRALLRHHDVTGCEERLKKLVQKVLIEEVSLHRFCYELGGAVHLRLVEALNELLRQEGRRIHFLQLDSPEIDRRPAELDEIEHPVDCHIRDYDEKIRVEHRLQLTIGDLGTFRRSRVTDLRAWAGERLDTITRSVLFDLGYLDLLLEVGRSDIKVWMEREAQAIGYQVKQLLTLPALDPLEWKEALPIESHEDTYVTTASSVEVRLNIVVKGRILDLRDKRLQPYLTPKSKLGDEMHRLIRSETQALMHAVDPERFYMHFNFVGVSGVTLRQEIEERIKGALIKKFAIDEDSLMVLAKPLETDITRRLAALQESPHSLAVTTVPHRSRGQGESVVYTIAFNVQGVAFSGWYTFLSQRFASRDEELDKIKEILAGAVRAALNTVTRELLQYTAYTELLELRRILNHTALPAVVAAFGLVISIVNLERGETPAEKQQREAVDNDILTARQTNQRALEIAAEARLRELRDLEQIRLELETSQRVGADSEELREVVARIAAINAEILPFSSEQSKQHVLPPAGDAGFDLADYQRALPTPPQRRQLEERTGGEER
jgi:hypothetical protein